MAEEVLSRLCQLLYLQAALQEYEVMSKAKCDEIWIQRITCLTLSLKHHAMFNHVCLSTQKVNKKGVSGSLSLTKDSTTRRLVPRIQPTPPTTKKFTAK